jgi:hypothetical protein
MVSPRLCRKIVGGMPGSGTCLIHPVTHHVSSGKRSQLSLSAFFSTYEIGLRTV